MIYLDSAATSFQKPRAVREAAAEAMRTMASPGRGAYPAAMRAADKVYECREKICELFNFPKSENVVFTQNATHALNVAIRTLASRGSRVVISGYEHNAVTRPLYDIGAEITVAAGGLFDSDAVLREFAEKIKSADICIVNHVSNVFGFVQPVYDISRLCEREGVPLIIDASQSAGVIELDCSRLKAAFIAMPGHKGLLGPQGTGVLLCGSMPAPLICGGTGSDSIVQAMPDILPDRAEAGTLNVPGIAGLCEGVKFILRTGTERIAGHESSLCRMAARILSADPDLEIFAGENQAGVLSLRHKTLDCERLCDVLSSHGIAARCGLHCAPLAHKTAGTLGTGTLRLSFSPFISARDVAKACEVIKKAKRFTDI